MALQRFAVVGALVAEYRAARLEAARVAHQPIPVIVPDFVAEMADQRAVRLAERRAPLLTLGVVAFGDVERDQAVVVTGHHSARAAAAGPRSRKSNANPRSGIVDLVGMRQPPAQQRAEHIALGEFDLAPALDVLRDR